MIGWWCLQCWETETRTSEWEYKCTHQCHGVQECGLQCCQRWKTQTIEGEWEMPSNIFEPLNIFWLPVPSDNISVLSQITWIWLGLDKNVFTLQKLKNSQMIIIRSQEKSAVHVVSCSIIWMSNFRGNEPLSQTNKSSSLSFFVIIKWCNVICRSVSVLLCNEILPQIDQNNRIDCV